MLSNLVTQQATMLAYIDNFKMLGVAVLAMIPFVFLMKKVKPGGADGGTLGSEHGAMHVRMITLEREYGSGGAMIAKGSPHGWAGNTGTKNSPPKSRAWRRWTIGLHCAATSAAILFSIVSSRCTREEVYERTLPLKANRKCSTPIRWSRCCTRWSKRSPPAAIP